MGLLQRAVFFDLIRVFSLALLAITSIFVLGGVAQEAARQGLGPEHLPSLVGFLLPGMLPFTVPATTLFAVSVVYGRMAGDNEITAVKAAGISIQAVVWPALLLGALLSAVIFVLYLDYIPGTHHRLRSMVQANFENLIYARLKQTNCFKEPKVSYSLFVRGVQGRTLLDPIFKILDDDGKEKAIIKAEEAELRVDLAENVIIVEMHNATVTQPEGQSYDSPHETLKAPLPNPNQNRLVRARERSMAAIPLRRIEVQKLIHDAEADAARPPAPTKPPVAANSQAGAKEKKKPREDDENDPYSHLPPKFRLEMLNRELGELDVEWAMRPALALGCFFFTLVGVPVAIWFQKRDYLSNFVTCFLPIVLVNYPLLLMAIQLGKTQKLDPDIGMWLGNAALGVAGVLLLRQVSRR